MTVWRTTTIVAPVARDAAPKFHEARRRALRAVRDSRCENARGRWIALATFDYAACMFCQSGSDLDDYVRLIQRAWRIRTRNRE